MRASTKLILICIGICSSTYNQDDFFYKDLEQERANGLFNEEEQSFKEWDFITIGLGSNCHPAGYTRRYRIRSCALPFDWCLTPYSALINFITIDFKNYFKKKHLVPFSNDYFSEPMMDFFNRMNSTTISENYQWVLDKKFGMVYNHDFYSNDFGTINKCYKELYAKYRRRIKRFYEQINSGKYVYFIRFHDITKQQTLELYQLLKSKFPHVPFTLIVIGDDQEIFRESWNIPYIKNFYSIGQEEPFWIKLCADIKSGYLKMN